MTIVIAAGGTGGHLYPGVALAREFLRRDPSTIIRFVGTIRGLETKVLPHESLPLDLIPARPVMGLGLKQVVSALLTLPNGILHSLRLLKRHHADLVVGIGGYTSPPVIFAAWLLKIPRVIVEPNAYPGMANKVLGPLAQRVFVAFEPAIAHFAKSKVRVFGTPIRHGFLQAGATSVSMSGKRTLLVFGGSRGAHAINMAMIEAVPFLAKDEACRAQMAIIHQTGEADYEPVEKVYESSGLAARVVPFLFDMPAVLREADLVVSRAGAMTLAELTACGKPAVLIPLPHAIYQHQARNAEVMQAAGAATMIMQRELTGVRLAETIKETLFDADRLQSMGERSRSLARTEAAQHIVDECFTVIKRSGN